MTLLRKIQEEAAGEETPLSVVLRNCQILAARLGNDDFASWVDRELNGYPEGADLPSYRASFSVEVHCNLAGSFNRRAENIPVGRSSVKAEHEELLFTMSFTEGVSEFEELLKGEGGTFSVPWPADAVTLYADKVFEDMIMITAWRVIGRGRVRGLLDSVRSKVLAFALKIEEENPEAGEASIGSEPIAESTVSNIVNNFIYGDGATVASGSGVITQEVSHEFNVGDFAGLRSALDSDGVPSEMIESLEGMLVDDDVDVVAKQSRAQKWLGQLAEGVATKSITLAAGASVESVVRAVHHFLGI